MPNLLLDQLLAEHAERLTGNGANVLDVLIKEGLTLKRSEYIVIVEKDEKTVTVRVERVFNLMETNHESDHGNANTMRKMRRFV